MDRKQVLKRFNQIYALSIQKGLTEEEFIKVLNESFSFLYKKEEVKN